MNKIMCSLAFLFITVGLAKASDVIPFPVNQQGIASTDARYGGYKWSTAAFALNQNSTITLPTGFSEVGIAGAIISSGPGTTFVEFFSSAGWSSSHQAFLRISNATSTITGNSTSGTMTFFPVPFRVERSSGNAGDVIAPAVIWRVTNGDTNQLHNLVTVPYVLK